MDIKKKLYKGEVLYYYFILLERIDPGFSFSILVKVGIGFCKFGDLRRLLAGIIEYNSCVFSYFAILNSSRVNFKCF